MGVEQRSGRIQNQMTSLCVDVWGHGELVVLVHGSGGYGEAVWADQRELSDRYQLLIPHRRGYGNSPPSNRSDFEVDAEDIAELLGSGAHLVGFSYGGVGSLLAAARRPAAVYSLTVIEPPAFGVARSHLAVEELIENVSHVYASAKEMTPEKFDAAFDKALGFAHEPMPLTPEQRKGVQMVMVERPPWEADIPLDRLAAAAFPKLVVSGAWNGAFDAVCDIFERRLHAERAVFKGKGHGVQHVGKPFNQRLKRSGNPPRFE